jgi:hypothetical protein
MDGSIVRKYLDVRRGILRDEGIDADALLETASDADAGASTLPKFASIVRAAIE